MLNIAFVACNKNASRFRQDPSFIYRCENLAAALRARGNRVHLWHLSHFPYLRHFFDIVVLHRPRAGWRLTFALAWLRRRGSRIIADFDDLVFDPALAAFSPGVLNGLVGLETTRGQFAAHRDTLRAMDAVTVSTSPLAETLRAADVPRACVVPNAVHHDWLKLKRPPVMDKTWRIAYCPGTRSHDRDFSLITRQIEEFLHAYPQTTLAVTGPLSFIPRARPEQLRVQDKLPFMEYHHALWSARVNLAPLEDTPFNRCKSAIKILEAGFWGIPTLCSPLPDAERFVDAGAMITADGAWGDRLERLLLNDDHYNAQTANLSQQVLDRADIHAVADRWLRFVLEQKNV
ncbi:Glycosyltransferase family 1 protein [Gammaproteobacteria bacterium]